MDLLVLLGAPGSGKGSVAVRLAALNPNIKIVVTGDLLREAVARGTPLGLLSAGYMRRGALVPDDMVAQLIGAQLAEGKSGCRYVLDGFPRTIMQAGLLEKIASAEKATLKAVIKLEVPEAVLLERLAGRRVCTECARVYHLKTLRPKVENRCDVCNGELVTREDDKLETVKKRLKVYVQQTLNLVDYYESKGLLRRIDGSGLIDDVVARVVQVIE